MTDRERWRLRGPVRSCRLERRWYSRRCGADTCDTEERGDATTVDFRPDGNLSRRSHHNPDGSEWISTYEYDDRGRLTQMRTETAGGVAKLRFRKQLAGQVLRLHLGRTGQATEIIHVGTNLSARDASFGQGNELRTWTG
jgi:YD repeat-containing protein